MYGWAVLELRWAQQRLDIILCKYPLIAFILQHVIIALLFILWRFKKVFSFPFFPILPSTGGLQTVWKAHALPQWPQPALKPDKRVRITNNRREGWEEGSKITRLHSLAICLTWCIGLQLNLEIFPQWENSFHGAQIYLREVNLLQKQPEKIKMPALPTELFFTSSLS